MPFSRDKINEADLQTRFESAAAFGSRYLLLLALHQSSGFRDYTIGVDRQSQIGEFLESEKLEHEEPDSIQLVTVFDLKKDFDQQFRRGKEDQFREVLSYKTRRDLDKILIPDPDVRQENAWREWEGMSWWKKLLYRAPG